MVYKYIAVDFDGTLCTHNFPDTGVIRKEHEKVINFIKKHKELGSIIILWTCREDTPGRKYLTEAIEFCRENKIPIDYANESPDDKNFYQNGIYPRKVFANIYIDDLAINALDI